MAIPSPVAPGGLVVRSQSDAAPPVATSVACASIVRRSVTTPAQRSPGRDRAHRLSFGDANARVREHAVDEHAKDLLAGGGACDVEHAAARVPAFEPRLGVERHAQLAEIGNPGGRLPDELADGALAAEAAPGPHRVLRVQLRAVVGSRGRGHATLGEVAGGRAKRPLGQQQHLRLVADAQRGVEARDAAADDGEIAAGSWLDRHCASFSL